MDLSALDPSILGPAFVAGVLVLATHVPFGREVLGRGIIFIDLAVAQIAGLGVIAAHAFGFGERPLAVEVSALAAALIGAGLLELLEERFPDVQEALIGVSFVLAATLAILLLANDPHGGEELRDLLVGQILFVSTDQLWPTALVYAAVLAAWLGIGPQRLGRTGFYMLFAVVVTLSVQLVGVYLVFASLIIPALATRNADGPRALLMGWGLGVAAYAVGLAASAVWDLPTGALIVWALAVLGAIMAAMSGSQAPARAAHR
jgi:zinc/manganese transport system permease protein